MSSGLSAIEVGDRLELVALPGIPIVQPGDDVPALICDALARAGVQLESGRDALVVTSKIVSRGEDRFTSLSGIEPSPRACDLAAQSQKDPRMVELILREASAVSRVAPNVIIVRHHLGFVSANAGIDESNVRGTFVEPQSRAAGEAPAQAGGPWVLLLPRDPDASARAIRGAVRARFGADIGVVLSDSHGRPFRIGTVGIAVGLSGLPALWDQRGGQDLQGRVLQHTVTAFADQLAGAADLVAGQADEGRPVVLVRGLRYAVQDDASVQALLRPPDEDLYL